MMIEAMRPSRFLLPISSQELMLLRKDVANYRDIDHPDPERDRIDQQRRTRQRARRPSGP